MNKFIYILAIVILPFCVKSQTDNPDLYMDAYIVIIDSSYDYNDLREQMLSISKNYKIEIDTGKVFDKEKKLICLPKDDEDELYAGKYIPRRYPSKKMSIEHLIYYTKGNWPEGGEVMILVSGIYTKKTEAEKLISKLDISTAYILYNKMYMGCMH